MKDPKDHPPDLTVLRRRAEEQLQAESVPPEELSPAQAARLIHELRVHEIELEMQNDELRRSQALLEESRSKYADLFDFAPVGYLTLDALGKIVEANLTAATLLGVERSKLLNRFFPNFLVEKDRRVFRQLMSNGLNQRERRGEFHLKNGDVRVMLIDILFLTDAEGQERRRVSLTDITQLKRTQEELRLYKEDLEELVTQRTTELIEANDQLREANDNLRAFFTAAPLAIAVFDAEGKVTTINPAAERLYGWTLEEVQGRLPLSIPKESSDESLALLQRVLGGESVTGVEIKQQRQDGTILDASVSGAPLYDAYGKLRGFIGLAEDITERKKLAEDVSTQALVLASMAEGVAVTDQRGQIMYTNPAFDAMFGYKPGELVGRHSNILNHTPPEENAGLKKDILTSIKTSGIWTGEFRNCRKSGSPFYTSARISTLTVGGKKLYISVQEDITQQKKTRETLARQAELLDLAQDAILVRDLKGRITYWNQGAAHHYGWPQDKALGQISHNLLQTAFPQPLLEIERQLLEQGFWEGELIHTASQGRKLVMNCRWTAKRDDTGRVIAILEINQNITAQKEIEKEVHRLASFPLLNPNPVLEADKHGTVTYANPAARHLAEEFRFSGGAQAFLPPDLKEKFAALAKGGPRQYAYELNVENRVYAAVLSFPHDLPTARLYALDITERQRAEAALRKSEQRFRRLVEANVVGIVVSDEEKIVEANDEFLRLVGYTREEMLAGKVKWVEMTPREYIPQDAQALYELKSTGAHTPYEKIFRRQDGSPVPVVVGGALLEEEPLSWVSFVLDISDRKRLEDSLRLSEARFRAIFANASIGITTTDLTGRLQEFNAPVVKGLGYTPKELRDINVRDITHPDDLAVDQDLFTELAAGKRDRYQVEKRYIRKDGRTLWGRLHVSLVRGPGGEPDFTVALMEDITLRKEAQAALAESEARYRSLVDLSPDAIMVHARGRYVFANPAGLKLFGAAVSDDLIGRRVMEMVHPDSQKTVRRRLRAGERLDIREVKILRLDGNMVEVEVAATPIRYGGQPAVQVVLRDITERKAAEKALRESEERLRLAVDAAFLVSFEWDILRNEVRRFVSSDPTLTPTAEQSPSTFEAVREAVHPEDRELFTANIRAALEHEDGRYENEFRIVHPDGQVVWLYERGYVEHDEQGRPTRLIGLSQDITERKQAEVALRESEARERARAAELEATLDTAPGVIFIAHDPECQMITGNRAAYELLRRAPGSNLSKSAPAGDKPENFRIIKDGRDIPATELPVQRAAASGEMTRNCGVAMVFEDGSIRHILGDAVPLLDEAGQPRGAVAAFLDITDRKAAQEETQRLFNLVQSEKEKLSALVNSISDEVWFADTQKKFTLANPSALQEFGLDSSEEIDVEKFAASLEVFRADGSPRPIEESPSLRALKGELIRDLEEIIRTPATGELRHRQVSSSPVRDGRGNLIGSVSVVRDITAGKAAEAALRESEARERARTAELQTILDAAPAPIFLCNDPSGRIITGNPAAYELLRLPPGSNVSSSAPDLKYRAVKDGQELPVLALPVQMAIAGQTVRDFEYDLVLADGTIINVSGNASPFLDDTGRVRGAVGAYIDLTSRKAAEAALREALTRYQILFNTSPIPIITTDINGVVDSWNTAAERLFGWKAAEVIGRFLPTVPDEHQEELAELFRLEREGQFFRGREVRRQKRDGSVIDVALFSGALRDGQGNITGFISIMEDITARKAAEEVLQESERRFRQVVESLPQLVWTCQPDGSCDFLSKQWLEFTGLPEVEQLGYGWLYQVHPDDQAGLMQAWKSATDTGSNFMMEFRVRRHDGVYHWFDTRAVPLRDEKGAIVRWFGSNTDIQAQRELREALLQAKEEWERTFDAVPDFISILDKDHRIVRVNKAMSELLAAPPAEGVGHPCYRAVHGLEAIPDFCPYAKVLATGQAASAEVEEFGLILDVSVSPIFTPNGQLMGGVHIARDITEKKRSEEALTESEARYRSIFENSHAAMILIDPETGAVVDANPAACAYYGYSREEFLEKRVTDINTLSPEQVQEEMQKARDEARRHFEFKHRLATGVVRDVEVFSGPIRFRGRELLYSIVHDVTARKEAENAVRESEARFRSLFEGMTEGVAIHEVVCDEQGAAVDYRILAINPAYTVHTGLTAEQVQGRLASEAYGLGVAPYLEVYARVAHLGQPETFEIFFEPLKRYFSVSATSPKPGHFVTVFEDITARKRLDEDLRRSNQRLDLLAEVAGRLLAADSPQEVVDSLCQKVMEFLDCDLFFNFLVAQDKEEVLHLNAYAGIPEDAARRLEWLNYGSAVCGCVARDGSRIVCEDIQNSPDPRTELVKSFGIQAYACHPLMVGGRVQGTVSFGSRRRTSFNPDELALMKAVADQVAIAMERQLAEGALRRAKGELEQRVEERTAALRQVNEQLFQEIQERQEIEEQLRDSEARFTAFMEHLPGLAVMRDMEGRYLFANRAWEENMNLKPGQWRGKTLAQLWPPERTAVLQKSDFEIISTGEPTEDVEVQTLADGPHHFLTSRFPIRDAEGLPYMVGAIAIDITARQQAEQQVAETGRLYRVLSQINEAIMRGRDQQSLFDQVCRILVEEGLFSMANVALIDPRDQVVRAKAKFGADQGYLDDLEITLDDSTQSQGPIGTAIREDRPDFCNDFTKEPRMAPWREKALQRGYLSSGAFPLHIDGKVVGIISLYASRTNFFTHQEITLLTSLADNLSFALEFLDREAKRRQAEEALATERQRFLDLLENLPAFVYLQAPDYSLRFANREFRERFGEPDGGTCYTLIWGKKKPCTDCPTFSVFHTGRPREWEWTAPDSRIYQVYDYPFADVDGSPLVLEMGIDITSRKEAEEALAEQAMLVQDLYNNAPCGYHSLDSEGYFVQINDTELSWLGYNRDEVIGKLKFSDLIKPEGLKTFQETFPRLKTRGWIKDLEYELIRKDGTTFPVLLNATAITDEDGSYLLSRSTIFDITDRKRAEKALARSEAMLRLILDTLPVGVWVTDRDGHIIEGNPAARRIWGGARYVGVEEYGEYLGWWADTGKKIEPEEWALARAIQKGETSTGEVINIQCFDGTHKTIINSGAPLFGENQEILGAIVVNQDITEMRRAEQVIREQGRQLEAFFGHSLTPVVFLDRDFNFLRVNEAYARACQKNTQDFIGHNHFTFYPHAENEAIFAEVVRSKTPYQVQAKPFEFPDHPEWGVTYWDWSLTPILDQAGEVDFLVYSLRDVTRRVMSEQARNRLIEILEATPDFVGIADFYGNLQYLNQAGRTMVGLGEDEDVSSLKVLELHPEEIGRQILERGVPQAMKEGAWQAELALMHRDGHEIPVSQVVLAHKDPAGRVQFFSTVARDITAMKEAQANILRQSAILDGINRIFRETLTCETAADLGQTCLAIAEGLTNSQFGFITEINQQDQLDALALTEPDWQSCGLKPARDLSHVKSFEPTGLLARPLTAGKAVFDNDPASFPDGMGVPQDYPPLTAYLGIPLVYGGRKLGLLGLSNKKGGYTPTDLEVVESLAPAIVEALMHHRAEDALKDSESKLRYLADQLLTAQENERKRLAAELHDELGHALLALKLHLSSIEKKLPPEQDDAKQAIRGQLDYIHAVIQDVRRLYHDLSPGDVEDLGLTKALRTLVNDFAGHFPDIAWEVDLVEMEGLFSLPVQTTIYRILQEALTNIGKHANPNTVTIASTKENHQVRFIVADDGAGFDANREFKSRTSGRGVGLVAMEERLNMVGGTFEIQSRVNEGTRLSFTIPAIPEGERP